MIDFVEKTKLVRLKRAHGIVTALFHAGFPGAVVAGGYLRDTLIGQRPKDLDVFIPYSELATCYLEPALSKALGEPMAFQFDLSYGEDTEINRVFTVTGLDGLQPPAQVIEMAPGIDPAGRVDRFDFGICQAWLGLDGCVQNSEAFAKDLLQRTATLVHCENGREHARSLRRWERWSTGWAKDWTLVDPFAGKQWPTDFLS